MLLKNKKTGEIVRFSYLQNDYVASLVLTYNSDEGLVMKPYESLAELNAEWCDVEEYYEEPTQYWYMDYAGFIHNAARTGEGWEAQKKIGNCFETKEEAELAVRKLRAWERLKDRGFKFGLIGGEDVEFTYPDDCRNDKSFWADIDLLFCEGGEDGKTS